MFDLSQVTAGRDAFPSPIIPPNGHPIEALPSFHSSDVASRGGSGFAAPWMERYGEPTT